MNVPHCPHCHPDISKFAYYWNDVAQWMSCVRKKQDGKNVNKKECPFSKSNECSCCAFRIPILFNLAIQTKRYTRNWIRFCNRFYSSSRPSTSSMALVWRLISLHQRLNENCLEAFMETAHLRIARKPNDNTAYKFSNLNILAIGTAEKWSFSKFIGHWHSNLIEY